MKRVLRTLVGLAVVSAAAAWSADDWVNLSTVSMTNATTPKLTSRYVCYTDGTDIACNGPSLYVTTGGLVGVSTSSPAATLDVRGIGGGANFFNVSYEGTPTFYIDNWGKTVVKRLLNILPDPSFAQTVDVMLSVNGLNGQSGNIIEANAFGNTGGNLFVVKPDGNIGISTTAPNAKLDVYGTISATNFVGNGAGLTGIVAASSDRITSGTAMVIVNSATGYTSFSTGGVVTGYYSPGGILSSVGISTSSNQASFTTVYASGNVGVAGQLTGPSLVSTSSNGTVSGTYGYFAQISASNIAAASVPWSGVTGKPASIVSLSTTTANANEVVYFDGTNYTGASATTLLGLGTMAYQNANAVAITGGNATGLTSINATYLYGNQVSGTTGYFPTATINALGAGNIAMTGNLTGAALISTATGGIVSGTYGYFRNISGTNIYGGTFTGDGSGLTGVVASSGDRITSGSAMVIVNSATGYTSFSTGGVVTGYFSPGGILSSVGISTSSNQASFTTVYASGNVGIGAPNTGTGAALEVSGALSTRGLLNGFAFYDRGNPSASGLVSVTVLSRSNNQTTIWDSESLSARLIIDHITGNVGISTTTPKAKLDVVGTISTTDAIQVGASTMACSSGISGSMRWGNASDTLQVCNGTGWVSLSSNTTVVAEADPQVGTLTASNFCQVNGGGTAIDCGNDASAQRTALGLGTMATQNANAVAITGGTATGLTSISATYLYGNQISGTSGYFPTATITALSAGSIAANSVSSTLVSATNISGTLIQAGASAASCASAVNGAIRYNTTSNTLQVCLGSAWTSLVSNTGGATVTGTGSATAVAYWSGASGLTYDADGFYWDATNNRLGIGTNAPGVQVDVLAADNGVRVLSGNTANYAYYSLGRAAGEATWAVAAGAGQWAANAAAGDSVFRTENKNLIFDTNAGTGAASLYIKSGNGNVGIAVAAPTAALQVSGTFIVSNSTQVTTPSIYVSTGTGYVGIGTSNPSETLHLGASTAKLRLNSNGAGAGYYAYNDGSGNHVFSVSRQAVQVGLADALFASYSGIGFQPNATTGPVTANTKMYLNTSGNLGLGTITPTATLQVSGTFTVSLSTQTTTPSLYVNSSGGVGIGTSSLSGGMTLDVNGNARSAGNLYWGSSNEGRLSYDGSSIYIDDMNASGGLVFRNGAAGTTERLRIDSAGRVGISNTSPLAKLDVNGTISASDAIQVGASTMACSSGISGSIRWGTASNTLQICGGAGWVSLVSGTAGAGTVTGTGSATAVAYWSSASGLTYDTDGFYWDATNNRLGIGTSAPNTPLVIQTSDSNVLGAFKVYNTGTGDASMFVVADGAAWAMGVDNSDGNKFKISNDINSADVGVSTAITIDSTRNVGIGTVTPTSTLQVSGTFSVSNSLQTTSASLYVGTNGGVSIGSTTNVALGSRSGLYIARPASSWGAMIVGEAGNQSDLFLATPANTANARILQMVNVTDALHIRTVTDAGAVGKYLFTGNLVSGNVGISNTTPIAKLDVTGTISASDAIQVSGSSLTCAASINGAMRYQSTSGTLQVCTGTVWASLISNTTGGVLDGLGSANHVAYWSDANTVTYDSSQLYWDATNNRLGVAMAAPTSALQVSGTFTVSSTVTNISPALYVSASGPVGIGTGAPTARLTVVGTGGTSRALLDSNEVFQFNDAASGAAYGTVRDGTRTLYLGSANAGSIPFIGAATNHAFGFQTNATERMRIDTSGNVGIGTTIPSSTLDVMNASSAPASAAAGWDTGAGAQLGISTLAGNATNNGSAIAFRANLNGAGLAALAAIKGAVEGTGTNNGYLSFLLRSNAAYATERMRITSAGNVGISNTSPIAKLDVTGTVSASDAIQVGASTLTCNSSISGSVRWGTASNTLQICAGAGWVSLASGTTAAPSFLVNKNGTHQTVSASTYTILTFSNEVFDTNGNFASNKFTPTVAGKYLITGSVSCSDSSPAGYCIARIAKNGSTYASSYVHSPPNDIVVQVSTIVDMNGSTDYVELIGFVGPGTTISGVADLTYFTGTLVAGTSIGASDERLKEVREPFTPGLEAINSLRPISYQWKKDSGMYDGGGLHAGFSAQDVAKAIPAAVTVDERGYLNIQDRTLMAATVNAVRELKAANDNMVSATTSLRLELEAANDNHLKDAAAIDELRKELRDLKNGVGFKRAVGQ